MVTQIPGDFHLQAESTPDPVLAVDSQLRLVVFNSAAETFLGYKRQQVLGHHLNSLLIGGLGPISLARLQEAVASGREGEVGATRVSVRHEQGYQLPMEATISLMRDDSGFRVVAALKKDNEPHDGGSDQDVINRINHILTGPGPWEDRFGTLHRELHKVSSVQWMGLLSLRPNERQARLFTCNASYTNSRIKAGSDIEFSHWLTRTVSKGKPRLKKIHPRGGHPLEKQLYLEGLRQLMVLPLTFQDEIIGAVMLGSMAVKGFTMDQTELIRQLVPQLSTALDRELSTDRLAISREPYQGFLENMREAYFRSDTDTHLLFANPALAQLLGYADVNELLANRHEIPFFSSERNRSFVSHIKQEGDITDERVRLSDRDGEPVTVNLSARLVRDPTGRAVAIEGTLQDLTEQERLTSALQEFEVRFNKVFTDSADCILLADESGLITDVNLAAQDMLGFTRVELIGRPIDDLMALTQQTIDHLQQGQAVGTPVKARTKDGEQVDLWQAAEMVEEGPERIIRSVSRPCETPAARAEERIEHVAHKLEERLSVHREVLANSEQMAELGRLVTSIAWDINNPENFTTWDHERYDEYLAMVQELMGQYELLAQRVELTPDLEKVMASLKRLRSQLLAGREDPDHKMEAPESFDLDLIPGLEPIADEPVGPAPTPPDMDLGRDIEESEMISDTGKQEPDPGSLPLEIVSVDLNKEVGDSLQLLESQLRQKATVLFEPGKLSTVKCDREQIGQVLMNLLLNAAEAVDRMGTIKVSTREEQDWVVVEISDDGIGLTRRELDRIFDPFYTTKDEANGLGLTISKRIVKTHGGCIQIHSKKHSGSTFSIHLPQVPIRGGAPQG